jgi:hypothetical protein
MRTRDDEEQRESAFRDDLRGDLAPTDEDSAGVRGATPR